MKIRTFALAIVCAIALAAAVTTYAARSAVSTSAASCSASGALNAIADALTSGSDAKVLAASVASERRLRACGLERDAIAAELISADAYGDTSQPASRCAALIDAASRSKKLGDTERASAINRAIPTCRKSG